MLMNNTGYYYNSSIKLILKLHTHDIFIQCKQNLALLQYLFCENFKLHSTECEDIIFFIFDRGSILEVTLEKLSVRFLKYFITSILNTPAQPKNKISIKYFYELL